MPQSDASRTLAVAALDSACSRAMTLQIAGKLAQAEALYLEILQSRPTHAAANYCIGMLRMQQRRAADGLPHLLAALEGSPQIPDYWLGYLEALLSLSLHADATTALALGRHHGLAGEAVENLAGRLQAAMHPTANEPSPDIARAAPVKSRAERRRHGLRAQREERALLDMIKEGRLDAAQPRAREMTEYFPERSLPWKVLGALLWSGGCTDEALAAMQASVRLQPPDAEAYCNLGTSLSKMQRFTEAQHCFEQALLIDPGFAAAHHHLGDAYQLQGRYAEAEASIRAAISLRSDGSPSEDTMVHSTLLFMLSHNPAIGADALFAEHCRVGEHFESRLRGSWPRHKNDRDPDRCLRVGLVSGDLYDHAMASFIEPVLAQLRTHPGLKLYAYSNTQCEDGVTQRLKPLFERWNAVHGLPDNRMAKLILDDEIDILIDLSGHTALNRLRTFARRPAPIQASWLGYPGTTGLRAIDYYLADRYFLPAGEFDKHFAEKIIYLPSAYAFQPHPLAPSINDLPALETGSISFGSFNRLGKINDSSLDLWAPLLRALPESRMVLVGIAENDQKDKLIAGFAARGVTRGRLAIYPRRTMEEYLALHHLVDICLDTTPYTGGTTTNHALWMGVPTLTLTGKTPASRQGAANLGHVRLDGFSVATPGEFFERGLYWAGHLAELAAVRSALRENWRGSPMRDPEFVASGLERALREMWRRWCAGLSAESFEVSDHH